MRSTLGLFAVAAMVVGPALAFVRVVPGLVGFVPFALGGIVALLVGVTSVVQAVRGRGFTTGGGVALVAGVLFVAVAANGHGGPTINDFTTDPDNPPAFRHAGTIPANVDRDMGYPRDFAAIQGGCCADLKPAYLGGDQIAAFARAKLVAESMPAWEVTAVDPAAGTIEAVATTRLFGFHDDIVIRVASDPDGRARIDMRSKSRDGKGDMGTNAARIRIYMAKVASPH